MTEKLSGSGAILPFDSILTKGKLHFVFILLLTIPGLYAKEKQFNYLKNGVSFSIPIDWKTISDETLPNKGYYYSAESTKKFHRTIQPGYHQQCWESGKITFGTREKHERGGHLSGVRN